MKHARTLAIIFACLLCTSVVAASETPGPDAETGGPLSHSFDPLAPLFDVHQWTAVQSTFVSFGTQHRGTRVQVLKSITPTGTDGTGRLLYSVNLIVAEKGLLLYSFAPLAVPQFDAQRTDPVYYMDDIGVDAGCPLELRDVTGDQVPEIIFHAGYMGASDHATEIHVLQYTDGPTDRIRFRDIRADRFVDSWWTGVRFLNLDGRAFAVIAEPVDPPVAPGDFVSYGQPKFHKYLVYGWSRKTERFELLQTISHTRHLHDGAEAGFQADWSYIVATLKKR
jgi:hypothetical protein